MAYVLRAAAGQPNFRPAPQPKKDYRPRAASSSPSSTYSGTGGVPTAPQPSGNFPIWAIPGLALAAAMPIYGYRRNQEEIAVARAAHEARLAAEAKHHHHHSVFHK